MLVPLLLGVGLGDLLAGLPINHEHEFTGDFGNLLTGYGLWTGVTVLGLCLLHGATFLKLRTTGVVRDRACSLVAPLGWVATALVLGFVIWTKSITSGSEVPDPVQVLALIAVFTTALLAGSDHDGWSFTASAVAIAATIGSIFIELYPNVMVSSTNAAYNLTVHNAASGGYALKVMTIVAVIFFPLVLLYQGWSFHVFRGRVAGPEGGGGARRPPRVPADLSAAGAGRALIAPQFGVAPVALHQRGVRAPFGDPAAFEHHDLVHLLEALEVVGDEQHGAPRGGVEELRRERASGGQVEVLAGLVEDQHRETRQQRPRERQAASLAARDAPAVLPDLRGGAVGERPDPVEQAHPLERVEQLALARVAAGEAQVLLDRGVEDVGVLGHEPDHAADLIGREVVDLDPVEGDRTAVGQETDERPRERRLARPAGADQGHP